ncbi:2-amino-4-hydroxy-6-hydroxymethyldihydropteridine diphosphokinase [Vibrio sp. 10N.286.49.C2]|uniref:2-amino-4-hydroxy-6- hydroxymethyldihydropteridine diphosphokinase n=1 Tax=unclassified Vibrio TaxID=2614977 RepID=UPI000C828ACB|nr:MULTISPECIES: 2-amino-4-hydroxy-6-hydroxymethyldihydropteridine diphosphokinase [unclassified Vibrio]PMH27538.1 2-amino-4-hydroxy-6-hydroxymethyldihydropteridine diphosphokinase [Vibrio sp. 10N.286.49.C2]PMH52963.1 2-amino-4-hydroxy-6-hydroxymethyldihydropteridine diphosphokinase [Vibrio sp. 10N.286.49.B1]PMH83402.1 2-amino-4-hydroxy-6-hydroxymethyldihydropteridine diphosphokinase [Vibrio sp. 10N.286.48.B7]
MTIAYIGVGSNIDRRKHIVAACRELELLSQDTAFSPVYASESYGFSGNEFYNLVVRIKTSHTAASLSAALKEIEVKWGRELGAKKFQNRTLDLDILLFGNEISQKKPILPREDIFKYSFVIQPLYDLAPDLVIPQDGRTVTQIWQAMSDPVELRTIDLNL